MPPSSEQRCPHCQRLLAPDAAICPQCGLSLSAPAEGSPSTNALPSVAPPGEGAEGAKPRTLPDRSTESLEVPADVATSPAQVERPAAGSAATVAGPPTFWRQDQASAPPAPPVPPKARRSRKALVIGLAILVLLGASGGLAYILTRPQPTITITNQTGVSSLTGSPDTVLHVGGHGFSGNVSIVFLLDGRPAPGAPNAHSDANGNVEASLTITDDWTFGPHTLTARDAQNDVTRTGVSIKVIPAPVLTIESPYRAGAAAAIAQAAAIDISGKRFTPNATITILLDGNPLPDAGPITSDGRGRFERTLTPTGWALGDHTLNARDSQGFSTRQADALVVVVPGQAGTPGPNGAPADDADFTLSVIVQARDMQTGQSETYPVSLKIAGRPDPAGGLPCDPDFDDGQPHTFTGDLGGGVTYTETDIFSCSGTYQSGKLTYVEMLQSEQVVLSNGDTCTTGNIAFPYRTYEGAFSSASNISGTYVGSGVSVPCKRGIPVQNDPEQGTWTGSI